MEELDSSRIHRHLRKPFDVSSPTQYIKIKSLILHSIYIIRQGINTYYTYRIDTITQRLEDQQAERTKTIDKLKAATKYNSTQELLEKYGGATPAAKPKKPSRTPSTKSSKPIRAQLQRTGTGPPPLTANIPRPGQNQIPTPIQPSTPVQFPQVPSHSFQNAPLPPQNAPSPVGHAEFAPNAFSAPPQYAQGGEINTGGNWYDRILDLLMGDDETSPKNRIALICQNCRLVNGQAPPGTKNPSELRWRCFGCGGWNGEEDEGKKVVQEIKERIEQEVRPGSENDEEIAGDEDGGRSDGEDKEKSGEEVFETESTEDVVEVKAKRGRPKSGKKKA